MTLLTKQLRQQLPRLRATLQEADPMVWVKFCLPGFAWVWYAIEFDGEDNCFGYAVGNSSDLGYFRLSQLRQNSRTLGLPLKRDLDFTPCRLSALRTELGHDWQLEPRRG